MIWREQIVAEEPRTFLGWLLGRPKPLRPQCGVMLVARDERGFMKTSASDVDGWAEIDLPPGTYTVFFETGFLSTEPRRVEVPS
jgi:hypothetical protein